MASMTSVVDLLHTATLNRGCTMIVLSKMERGGWQASVRQADGMTYRVEQAADQIRALKKALDGNGPAAHTAHAGPLTYHSDAGTPGAVPHDDLFGPL